MYKNFLYLKVILLLVALGGVSSTHAAKLDNHNLLALSVFDFSVIFVEQTHSEDEDFIVVECNIPVINNISSPAHYSPVLTQTRNAASKPFARAPPAILPA